MREIIFFVEKHTPRIAYLLDFIFREIGGYGGIWITDAPDDFATALRKQQRTAQERMRSGEQLPVALCYSSQVPEGIEREGLIFLPATATLLFENGVEPQDENALQSDALAWAFYLLSRYEEYLPFAADAHGRFSASLSAATRAGILQRPRVDEIAIDLLTQVSHIIGDGKAERWGRSYKFLPTFDIDFMYAYAHKSALHTLAAAARDLLKRQSAQASQRWAAWRGNAADPFDNIDSISALHTATQAPAPLFFILSALQHSEYDRNTSPHSPAFADFLHRLHVAFPHSIGLHPSYAAGTNAESIKAEKSALECAANAPVVRSRQHFLRLRLPDTYRALLAANITEDYTMGYADAVGFRASTARAHWWYDLRYERATLLRVQPFMAMDVTLRDYLRLSPAQAVEAVQPLVDACRQTGGTFSLLWHNSSLAALDGWGEAWREAYAQMLRMAR